MNHKFEKFIENLKKNAPSLKEYAIWRLEPIQEIERTFEALKSNTTVKSVSTNSDNKEGVAPLLAACLAENKSIIRLELPMFTTKDFEELLPGLKNNTTIKDITIGGSNLTFTQENMRLFADFIINNKNFISLRINGSCTLNEEAMNELIKGLQQSRLKTLVLHNFNLDTDAKKALLHFYAHSKQLVNLILYNIGLNDQDLDYFSSQIEHIKKKKILGFPKNPVSEVGLTVLAQAVIKNPKLFILYGYKRENGTMYRFETVHIAPFIKRDWQKETKSFQYIF